MKYILFSVFGLVFMISSSQSQASWWKRGSTQSTEAAPGPGQPQAQKKKGFFSKWRERSRQKREQRRLNRRQQVRNPALFPEQVPARGGRAAGVSPIQGPLCQNLCRPPQACRLSQQEIEYCQQQCGQVDVMNCVSPDVAALIARTSEAAQTGLASAIQSPSQDVQNRTGAWGGVPVNAPLQPKQVPPPAAPDGSRVWRDGQVVEVPVNQRSSFGSGRYSKPLPQRNDPRRQAQRFEKPPLTRARRGAQYFPTSPVKKTFRRGQRYSRPPLKELPQAPGY